MPAEGWFSARFVANTLMLLFKSLKLNIIPRYETQSSTIS